MNTRVLKQKGIVFILVSILMVTFGTQNISYAQEVTPTITATVEAPLTETNLNGQVVTLTLSGATYARFTFVRSGVSVSGIDGVTVGTFDVDRVNDTKVTVELTFSGNIDTDTPLIFTVGADAIADYNGAALTAQVPVTAIAESLVATTESPLTEATLSGSVVTLTLSGRSYDSSRYDIERALTISGIEGVTASSVRRVSDTKVTITLAFSGNIDADSTLTITVGADAINNYNQAFTIQLPVTAVEESVVATTVAPLTEATLHGSVVTLTLNGRVFNTSGTVSVSGIDGVTISRVRRVSNTQMTVSLAFSGNIDADSTLTITVSAARIAGYNQAFTVQLPVTAVEESLVATTEALLTEATLSGSVVTLTLSGRVFNTSGTVSVSGIDGVTTSSVRRVSNTQMTVSLAFSDNIDADSTLTITVSAARIAGYPEGLTVQLPVTAVEESLVATTVAPLTEATLSGSVVTLTLTGRSFASEYNVYNALTVSGIEGASFYKFDVERIGGTKVTVPLTFSGNIDADSTLTITVGANAINNYNEAFTVQLPVTALEEMLTATTESPLTEATLSGSVVTLTLTGRSFASEYNVYNALTVSGIEGASFYKFDVERIGGTKVTVPLTFSGNIDADSTLTITVGANAINNYNEAFTVQLPVTALEEMLTATTESPLTEATLHGGVVTLTLSGRVFNTSGTVSVSGIDGVTTSRIRRVSNTQMTVSLAFSGNIDADSTLTITVSAARIASYNEAFTVQLPVTAVEESLVATTASPLTEATLSGSVVTLTLSGRSYVEYSRDPIITISGIEGVNVARYGIERVSGTEMTVALTFSGNIDTDATLTIEVGAAAIVGYNQGFTLQVPITAVEESLVATTETPLTEATLSGSVVTLTLSGRVYVRSEYDIERAITISGIDGITVGTFDVDRVSATKVTVELTFSGNIDTDATLTIEVGVGAIVGYNQAFTVQLTVTAVAESLVASTESPLTEASLHDSVVTLTLSGRSYDSSRFDIERAIAISGIDGVTVDTFGIDRVSNTKVTVELTFSGNIDADSTLTFTVGAGAIVGYNEAFTVQLPVTAVVESMTATTASPLTEATLHGSVVTLTLSGRSFTDWESDIRDAVSISGIEGVSVGRFSVDRVSNTKVTFLLLFSNNIDTDSTLTITVGADTIAGYNQPFTFQLPVTAVEESLVATTETPITEAILGGSVVTLTLSGRRFTGAERNIRDTLTISGIEGVTTGSWTTLDRVSDTVVTVPLIFSGNIDADSTLTITMGADAIIAYNQAFTVQLPVTAVAESMTATTASPLTEATLHGSVVTLTLSGRNFTDWESDIRDAVSISGIEGVSVNRNGADRVSNTEVTVVLLFSNDIDTDSTLTITVGADAIAGYNKGFTFDFAVAAVEERLEVSTETPLTEANLGGYVITFTLSGRNFSNESDIRYALTFSGIEGVFVSRFSVDRVSNTEVKVTLSFSGNIDTDGTLTIEVGADAIAGYNKDFTFEFAVPAVEERLEVSTEEPLTEAILNGGTITLKLIGRQFTWWLRDIEDAVTLSGIEGLTVGRFSVDRDSGSEVTIPLAFNGNIDTDAVLTITVEAGAIAGYNEAFTTQIPVTAVEESLDISSKFALNEANLSRNVVILTLNGRSYEESRFDIRDAVSVVTGIEGVTYHWFDLDRVSETELAIELSYDGTDFDTDGTLTFTVGADAIVGYGQALTAQIPVTAIKQSDATISISPNPIVSPPLYEQLTISLNITGGKDVAGFQAIVRYDYETLRYVKSAKGNYLPADAFYVLESVPEDEFYQYPYVPVGATALDGVSNGNGTLATLTFEVYDVTDSTIRLSNVYIVDRDGVRWEVEIEGTEVTEPAHDIVGDINRDGIVNIRDLVLVSYRFGWRGDHRADINGDGIVDIADLVLVANAIGANAAAPPLNPQVLELISAGDVKGWLTQARRLSITDPEYLRGITVLEQLHRALTPKETALLPNFPNPFNPETWIPYHLSRDADVSLHIYAVNGTLVRTLALGHQAAGMYQNRSRAAHWDGKNEFGEKVASGLYFYTLTAGDYTATRKMLIRK